MACLNPLIIKSPESRWLLKCWSENRPYEYYIHQANQRRNLQFDPLPLVSTPYDYYEGKKKVHLRYMSVPCGKCELCIQSKVDGYFVRCYFEYLHTQRLGGITFFATLTYGDENLPRWHGKPCFSKRHLQTFLKRLRKYSGLDFKYFIVTEYGGEFGRPHYHGLFFVREDISQIKFLQYVAQSWTKIEDRNKRYTSMNHWNFGNIRDVQRVDVKPLLDSKGIRYVTKYMSKQLYYEPFQLDVQCEKIPPVMQMFHLQSIGLGENMFDYCEKDIWEKGYILIENMPHAIPKYFKDKLFREFYCIRDNGVYVYQPTDFKYLYSFSISMRQIEEMKSLSLLNRDFPEPPAWVYEPENLRYLDKFFNNYLLFREIYENEPIIVQGWLDEWNNYLLDVQRYYRSVYLSKEKKIIEQKQDYYLKKSHQK